MMMVVAVVVMMSTMRILRLKVTGQSENSSSLFSLVLSLEILHHFLIG